MKMEINDYLEQVIKDTEGIEDPIRALNLFNSAYELIYNQQIISKKTLKALEERTSRVFTNDYLNKYPPARADLKDLKERLKSIRQDDKEILEILVKLDGCIITLQEDSLPK